MRIFGIALAGMAIALASAPARSEAFTGFDIVGLDSREMPPGTTVYNKGIYGQVDMPVLTAGATLAEGGKPFLIQGATFGFLGSHCDRGKGRIIYSSAGAYKASYTCRKGGPVDVRMQTNLTRSGSRWTFSGRAQVTGDWLSGKGTNHYDERIVMDVTPGGCEIVSFRSTNKIANENGTLITNDSSVKCALR